MINFINKNLVIVHGFCHCERPAHRSGREGENAGFLENTKDLVSYLFQALQDSRPAGLMKFVGPDDDMREVFYYGNFPASVGTHVLLMHRKPKDGRYRVVYRDS